MKLVNYYKIKKMEVLSSREQQGGEENTKNEKLCSLDALIFVMNSVGAIFS